MSGPTVISIQGLGKRYQLGDTISSNTLRDALAHGARGLLRRRTPTSHAATDAFWALRNVSFDVAKGEVIGIIGDNGAGKSTLLKILSGITDPTEGVIRLRGRIGALLEVGTGFHQELSGRENIVMNGAILGMSQAEIRLKFDEIVAFAGVERFLDTPVKRYSSGMLMRLGFAVAAHFQPEILVVDEVLAVGDQDFQKKCLGKMNEVSRSGRTVLFVSHNMAAVETLCPRCLLLRNGSVVMDGSTPEVLSAYRTLDTHSSKSVVLLRNHTGRMKGQRALMSRVSLLDQDGMPSGRFRPGATLSLVVDHDALERDISPVLGVVVKSSTQSPIFGLDNRIVKGFRFARTRSAGQISCTIPDLPLTPGLYVVDLYFGDSVGNLDIVKDAATFEVCQADVYGTGRLPGSNCGPLLWTAEWNWKPLDESDRTIFGSAAPTADTHVRLPQ